MRVAWMVLRESVALTIIGVALGVPAGLLAPCTIESLLYAVKPTDPATMVAGTGLLLPIAVLASYQPARRASYIDPMVALRYE